MELASIAGRLKVAGEIVALERDAGAGELPFGDEPGPARVHARRVLRFGATHRSLAQEMAETGKTIADMGADKSPKASTGRPWRKPAPS